MAPTILLAGITLGVILLAGTAGNAFAAVDFFLKIDGIEGESTQAGYEKWIQIESFSWGVSQVGSSSLAGGGGTGKASFSNFVITKEFDKATPKLAEAVVTGEPLEVTIELLRITGDKQAYMTYKLTNVMVSSVSQGSTGGSTPTESVSFSYDKFEMTYTPEDSVNQGGPVRMGYDLKAAVKI